MLEIGKKAPEFSLPDKDGKVVNLSDFRGKKVILYFYPKDNTPGCTIEAKNFRDYYETLQKRNVVVLGVSKDSQESHQKFAAKYELPFILLSDTTTEVHQLYESWGLKKFMGREYMGAFRNTFVIDEEGNLEKIFEKVKPAFDIESCLI